MSIDPVSGLGLDESVYSNQDHLRGLLELSLIDSKLTDVGIKYGDHDNDYQLNSHGYRSPEFGSKVDLITAGCSQTFGLGIPLEGSWPYLLSNTLSYSYVNLALPGWSAQRIVQSVISYIKQYGAPKVLAVVFPDLRRMQMVYRNGVMTPNGGVEQESVSFGELNFHSKKLNPEESLPNLSKRPHDPLDVLPHELPVYLSAQSIALLAEYCRAADITFLWSTWDAPTDELFSKVRSVAEIDLNLDGFLGLKDSVYLVCQKYGCSCFSTEKDIFLDTWDVGLDDGKHMGVKHHHHYAAAFTSRLLGSS